MRSYGILTLLFFLAMCSSNTEVYTSTFTKRYENGKSIEVIRKDRFTKWKGLLTGMDYGGTSNFSYCFTIEPDDSEWRGMTNQAPIGLVFCGDQTYLKATERIVQYDSLYGPAKFKDTTFYFKNIDERYFFKLFGDQYFVDADSIQYYENKSRCGEVPVPYLK